MGLEILSTLRVVGEYIGVLENDALPMHPIAQVFGYPGDAVEQIDNEESALGGVHGR